MLFRSKGKGSFAASHCTECLSTWKLFEDSLHVFISKMLNCCLLSATLLDRLFLVFFFNVMGFKILLLVVGGVKF